MQRKIKSAYGCSLDEADASEAGRHEYKIGLTEFYKEYAPNKPKSEIDKVSTGLMLNNVAADFLPGV